VLVAGLVAAVAAGASHISVVNFPFGRNARWAVLAELAGVALLYAGLRLRRPSTLDPRAGLAGSLLALALLSAAWSPDPQLTLGRVLTLAALFVASASIAYGAVGRPRAVGAVLLGLLAGMTAVALAGLVDLVFEYPRAVVPATQQAPARYNGIGGNPNQMAMLLALGVPIAVWALLEARSRTGKALAAAVLLLLGGSIVAAGSRGPLLAAFAGVVVLTLVIARRRVRRVVLASAAALLAVGVGVMQIPQPTSSPPHLNPIIFPPEPELLGPKDAQGILPLQNEIGYPSPYAKPYRRAFFDTSGRTPAWRGALRQALRRPLLGYGFGTEEKVFVDRYYLYFSNRVENSYLATLLQLGVVGLAVLLALLVSIVVLGWRGLRGLDAHARGVGGVCLGIVTAGLLIAVTQSYLTSVGSTAAAPFWIAAFLLAAVGLGSRAAEAPRPLEQRKRDERELDSAERDREARLDVMGS
jgi:O-Antigen ligase